MTKHGDRHHRKPKSRGGGNNEENISIVPPKKHQAWHRLFQNLSPQEIAAIINDCWLDPDFYFVTIPRRKAVGKRHRHTLEITCKTCGNGCEIKDVKTEILKKI